MSNQDDVRKSTADGAGLLLKLSEGLADAVHKAAQSTVRINARSRIGASGVVWSADGLIVTADHVIEREEDIVVGLPDDREVPASLVGRDPRSDLALLKIAEDGLAAVTPVATDSTRVGHIVMALGRPLEGGVQATMGVVSAIGGRWRSRRGGVLEGYVRTDVTMYPGFSGGPLVNVNGEVVGVNSSVLGRVMSVAIPMDVAGGVIEELRLRGKVKQPYLGVRTQQVALPQAMAAQLGVPGGLVVLGVEPEGPADRSGMLLGDVLVSIGGQPVLDLDDLQALLRQARIGEAAQTVVVRGGQKRELSLIIGERN